MKPLDRLSDYLGAIERRLRWIALTRGIAATAAAALVFTVVAVLLANHFSFSDPSVLSARVLLFLGLAFAAAAALVIPVIRLNRWRAARQTESQYPQFEERLLTFSERMEQNPGDPFLPLLASDTLSVAGQAEPKTVAKSSRMAGFSSAAAAAVVVLIWLATSGPGFLGYGTHLLWAGVPKANFQPFYDVQVQPGNKTVRKNAPVVIGARLRGFTSPSVRFYGKSVSASKWDQAEMRTESGGSEYQFYLAGVPETLDYYVEAGGVRSKTYRLNVMDLPTVKNIRVTYRFPAWTGMKDRVENPGGDLRAVEGTTADVAVTTDRPLTSGAIMLDNGTKLDLHAGPGNTVTATVPIQKDGLFHIAAIENSEDVRLTEDYFIEAQKYRAPEVKITRPGRDYRASPIEEVSVGVEGSDDYGLQGLDLHYAVNGGAEKAISLLQAKGAKNSSGTTVLSMEDFKVVPGDVVSMYATAKDTRSSSNTDIFFVEVQPFERNFSQSQQGAGGGGGGGGQQDQNEISERQKQIITATFNELKGSGAKGTQQENANFLSQVQGKLRDQAKSLADRMKSRQLSEAGDSFKSFVNDMEQAVAAMGPASDKLKGANWKDALGPEQQALQYLLRAEATRRDIQVAFGNRGGGGGGGAQGGARDLEGLFDLELDTQKNQYESASNAGGSQDQRQQQIDNALQKLEELARRQQELANQARQNQQMSQQRFQQEMLRREAEELQRQIEQMQRDQQNQQGQQQGQQSQQNQSGQGQGGQNSQGGQQSQQMSRSGQGGQNSQQLNQTLQRLQERLQQAVQNMRQANSPQQAGTPQSEAEAKRAAEALKDAQQMLSGAVGQQSANQVENLARQADDLARRQQDFEGQLRRAYGNPQNRPSREQIQGLADNHQGEADDLKRLEQQMQSSVRNLAGTDPKTSAKLRDALGEEQQSELPRDMARNSEYLRRGYGEYAVLSESNITQGLNNLRDRLKDAQQAMASGQNGKDGKAAGQPDDKAYEQALSQVEKLRQQMEQLSQQRQGQGKPGQSGQLNRGNQPGQQPGQGQPGQGQQPGQPQGQGQQPGQSANGNQGGQNAQGSPNQGGPNGGNFGNRNGNVWAPNGGIGNNDPELGWNGGFIRPGDFENTYRQTVQQLEALRPQVQGDPMTAKDLEALLKELQRLNPSAYANDPELSARIEAAMVGDLQQVEMELRRKVDEANGGSIRSAGQEPVPPAFADSVADYFRRLSKGK